MVGRFWRMVASTAWGVGRPGKRTAVAPTAVGKNKPVQIPYENESFAAENATSFSSMPITCPVSRAEAMGVVCTCLTAFGSPVDPDVYIQNATSSESVVAVNGCGLAWLKRSSRE